MNILTKKIKNKGYSLTEFCDANLMSLRTYRRYEKESNANHAMLNRLISELEEK